MAIVQVDPANWKKANVVLIDSDAAENDQAMLEMDRWAAEQGFARTPEYWLREIFRRNGSRVYRGICYRITNEIKRSAKIITRRIAERAARNPVSRGKPSRRTRAVRKAHE